MTSSGLVTSMSPVVAIWPAVTSRPGGAELELLGAFAFHLERELLDVEHDVGDVLADPRQAAELVEHAFDADCGDRGALQRREQHAAQAVAQRHAEATLERLGDEHRLAAAVATGLALQRGRLLEFLPVLCVDGHVHPLAAEQRRPAWLL